MDTVTLNRHHFKLSHTQALLVKTEEILLGSRPEIKHRQQDTAGKRNAPGDNSIGKQADTTWNTHIHTDGQASYGS